MHPHAFANISVFNQLNGTGPEHGCCRPTVLCLQALAALWCAPAGSPEQWDLLGKPQLATAEGAPGGGERQLLVGRVPLALAEDAQEGRDAAAVAARVSIWRKLRPKT